LCLTTILCIVQLTENAGDCVAVFLFCHLAQRKPSMKSHASMNRIYRLVWNAALNLWVAVAENAKGRGKAGSARNKAALLMLVPLATLMHDARAADAANATVSAGAASVATAGNTTTINQASQRAAIDWTSLSTRANEALIFNQPNAQAIALNRITGSSPSELLGSLTANGQVFILNPNGVLFGAGSQVNVGGLVASTLSMSNADFEAGNYKFTGSGGGSVVNQGTLNAAPGGYLALLAPEVRNEGVMTASLGTALLAAGNKVTLNLDNGSLLGYSIDQGAINALAENKQLIKADGGQVLLSAKAMDSLTTATVNNTGVIEAKTIQNKAGRILLMGDMRYGTVNVGGTLDASAPVGGDGGFIETSAAHVKVAAGTRVTTLSDSGKTGTWLIDPTDFTISSGSGSQTSSGIGANTLSANLATTSVTLATDASTGSDSGDINVNASVSWSANTTLTLNAYNNININAAITATGNSAGLVLNYGNYATAGTTTSGTNYKVSAPITLSGANATLAINGTSYTLIHSMTQLDAIDSTGLGGSYALAQDLDASGTTYSSALVGIDSGTPFTGTFAGLGHIISNLTIRADGTDDVGLFGYANTSSVIRDIGLLGGSVSGNNEVGALAGYNSGSISNAYATGSVSGNNYVGGLVGSSYGGSISNAYATGSVSGGSSYVGGLVGNNYGNISDAYATGSVSGSNDVGGLVGDNYGSISNAYATGSVTGNGNYVGGLVGSSYGGSISNAYAISSVSGSTYVGGLVGQNDGGIIGNAYATGNVAGTNYVGGLVGFNYGTIANSYASGAVTGSSLVGGMVGGDNAGIVTSSYWNTDTSGQSSSAGGTGLTSAQMLQASSFSGWDIATSGGSTAVWRVYEGYTAPLLRSFMTALTVTAGDTSKAYDGTTSVSSSYSLSDASADSSLILGTAAYGNVSSKNVGSYGFGISGLYSGQQGYDILYVDGTATITAATLTVNGTTAANKTYDGTTAATVSGGALSGVISGDTVALSSQSGTFSDKNAATGKMVTIANSLSGSDAGNYVVAAASTTADITAATLTVSGTSAANKTYDGTTAATLSGSLTGLISGDTVALSQSGTFSDKNTATGKTVNYTSSVSGTDAGNYVLASASGTTTADITAATLTVSGTTAANKTYDGTTAATVSGGALSGVISGDSVALSSQSGTFSDKNAATGKTVTIASSLSGSDAGNYVVVAASTTADITAAMLTVSGTTAANKTYDGTTVATLSGSLSGLISGDTVTLSQSGTFSDKNAATGKTVTYTSSVSGTDSGNYVLVSASGSTTADITAATLTVSGGSAANKTYDGTTAATVSGGSLSGLVNGDTVSLGQSGTFSDKNAATGKTVSYTSSLSGTDAGNYVLASSNGTATADITAAALAVTANDDSKTADGTAYSGGNGVSYNGLVTGDTATAVLAGNLAYGGSAQGAYLAGEYDITPSGLLANGNYSLRFVQGKLTLSSGDAASAALGGTALVGAYQTSLNSVSGGGLVPRVSADDSKGTGEGGAAATALNAAAAEGAGQDGGN
jgi:filamentous hemagglutinin family protein